MIKLKENKLLLGIITGFIFSFSLVALAETVNDSWNIGDGWLWFKDTGSGVRANVETPLEGNNIANKDFVEAAIFGEGGASGAITCATEQRVYTPNYSSNTYDDPYFWCCMPNADGDDMICIIGEGYTPRNKYADGSYSSL